MKKLAIVTIGIPGSGKTTAMKPLAKRYGLARISRDEIRLEWFGDPLHQVNKEEVHKEAQRRVIAAIKEGQSVIRDSTFTSSAKRQEVTRWSREAGAERVVGVIFITPLEKALEQNRNREAVVENSVIKEMYQELQNEPPTLSEGFDALYTSDQLDLLEERELR